MIGVVLATLVSALVAIVHLLTRTMTHQFESFRREIAVGLDGLRAEFGAQHAALRSESNIRFETVERGFAEVNRRLDRVDVRLDRQEARLERVEAGVLALDKRVGDLDRDVQALTSRQFGSGLPEV
jgi:hypothetical protein